MTIDQFNFAGKKAFVRVDFNVPLDENFNITDDNRMRAALPTLKKILADGGSIIIGSHLGRPKGPADKFSLKHILNHLSELLGVDVQFANDCMGEEAAVKAAALQPNEGYMKAVRLYQNVLGQFDLYMGHVATNIAGIYHNPISVEQTEMKAVEYVPKEIQKRAVDFLNKELFTTPTWLKDEKLSEKTGINTFNSIYRVQSSILKQLLNRRTLDKMMDNELTNGTNAYTANDLFRDLKKSIWSDLQGGKRPDASQRSLQKTYVNALIAMLDKPKSGSGSLGSLGGYSLVSLEFPSEAPAIARGQLVELKKELARMANASTGIVKSHYLNLQALIDAAFDVR